MRKTDRKSVQHFLIEVRKAKLKAIKNGESFNQKKVVKPLEHGNDLVAAAVKCGLYDPRTIINTTFIDKVLQVARDKKTAQRERRNAKKNEYIKLLEDKATAYNECRELLNEETQKNTNLSEEASRANQYAAGYAKRKLILEDEIIAKNKHITNLEVENKRLNELVKTSEKNYNQLHAYYNDCYRKANELEERHQKVSALYFKLKAYCDTIWIKRIFIKK